MTTFTFTRVEEIFAEWMMDFKAGVTPESREAALVESTLEAIRLEGGNQMRCVLTGAAYATITDSEIRSYLAAQLRGKNGVSTDSLMDKWDLAILSCSSAPSPALKNQTTFSLASLIDGTKVGFAKVVTYYITRLLFSFQPTRKGFNSTQAVDRMLFTRDLHETLLDSERQDVASLAYRLSAIDAWLPMAVWPTLPLALTKKNPLGLNGPKHEFLRHALAAPTLMPMNYASILTITDSLTHLMIDSEVKGLLPPTQPTAHGSLNVMAEVANALGMEYETAAMTLDPMRVYLAEAAWQARMDEEEKNRRKQNWSVTHGKGYLPGSAGPERRTPSVKNSATRTTKAKAPAKAKLTGKSSQYADLINSAVASITIDFGQ